MGANGVIGIRAPTTTTASVVSTSGRLARRRSAGTASPSRSSTTSPSRVTSTSRGRPPRSTSTGGLLRPVLVDEAEAHRERHDHRDDHGVVALAHEVRHDGVRPAADRAVGNAPGARGPAARAPGGSGPRSAPSAPAAAPPPARSGRLVSPPARAAHPRRAGPPPRRFRSRHRVWRPRPWSPRPAAEVAAAGLPHDENTPARWDAGLPAARSPVSASAPRSPRGRSVHLQAPERPRPWIRSTAGWAPCRPSRAKRTVQAAQTRRTG